MLIRLKLASHPRGEETPAAFPGLLPPARPRVLPLAYSVAIHAAVLALLPAVTQYGMATSARTDLSRYKVEMLPLRVPLYFPDAAAPAAPARRSAAAAKKNGAPAEREQSTASSAVVAPPRAVKPFELPAPAVRAKNTSLILQPDAGPAVQPAKPLPSMAFWARMESTPRRPVREFVTPGRTEQPAPAPRLDAPPVLAVPNREPKAGDVNVALSSTPARPVRLFVSNSSTVPVRLLQDSGASEAASLDAVAGEAANLIVVGATRPPATLTIEVPRGLSQGPPEAARAASGGAAGASGAAGKQAGASGAAANSGAAAESAKANASGSGSASAQSRSAGAAGRSPGGGSNGGGSVLSPPAAGPSAPPPPIKITHPPAGSFDVVIAQSGATGGDLPDAAGMLTGNPIYTVYLRVGDEREWLLEYCLPGEKKAQSNPYEINVGPVVQVTPPYPLFTSIPGSVRQRRRRDHVVLHGYLTASGAFRDVKAADPSDALGREILALLGDWRFRPALRDRTPIGVEVLLVVPPREEN